MNKKRARLQHSLAWVLLLVACATRAHAGEWIDTNGDGNYDTYRMDPFIVNGNNQASNDVVMLPTVYVNGNNSNNMSSVDWSNLMTEANGSPIQVDLTVNNSTGSTSGSTVTVTSPDGVSIYKTDYTSTSTVKAYTYDLSTVQSKSSGWVGVNSVNDPGMWAAFSLLKSTSLAIGTTSFVGFLEGAGVSWAAAAEAKIASAGGAGALGLASDAIGIEMKVDVKVCDSKEWYGSVDTRLTWSGLQTYVTYNGVGDTTTTTIVEATVSYRITALDGQGGTVEIGTDSIPGSTPIQTFIDTQNSIGFKLKNEIR